MIWRLHITIDKLRLYTVTLYGLHKEGYAPLTETAPTGLRGRTTEIDNTNTNIIQSHHKLVDVFHFFRFLDTRLL